MNVQVEVKEVIESIGNALVITELAKTRQGFVETDGSTWIKLSDNSLNASQLHALFECNTELVKKYLPRVSEFATKQITLLRIRELESEIAKLTEKLP